DHVIAEDLQEDRHAAAVGRELNFGDRADLHAGHEHTGAGPEAADVAGVEPEDVGFLEEGEAFAELQHQGREQHQAHEHEHTHFDFQTRFAHNVPVRKSPLWFPTLHQ